MQITVKTPCARDFEQMKKEGTKRFCDACKTHVHTHVHDLSSMTKADAQALLASRETEGLCVRFLYDERVKRAVFKDDLVGVSSLMRKAKAAVALALPLTLNACMGAYVGPKQPPAPAPPVAAEQAPAADAGAPVLPVAK
jgi:hypothetical protein